jgi:hypothetical protein
MTQKNTKRILLSGASIIAIGATAALLSLRNNSMAAGKNSGDAKEKQKAENWTPVNQMGLYLCAFHVAKENPAFEIEAHHYCAPAGGDLHQCVIYDSKAPNAKLLGIEYIIGNDTYQKLPAEEKKYWHPHAYEIVSGQLIAPDMPKQGDDVFPGLVNTWGKTWHTWRDPKNPVPMGEPMLMWSAGGDGQISDKLVQHRDAQFGISTPAIRERRKAMGYVVPNIPPPKQVNEDGRRWTAQGPDEPTSLPKTTKN